MFCHTAILLSATHSFNAVSGLVMSSVPGGKAEVGGGVGYKLAAGGEDMCYLSSTNQT